MISLILIEYVCFYLDGGEMQMIVEVLLALGQRHPYNVHQGEIRLLPVCLKLLRLQTKIRNSWSVCHVHVLCIILSLMSLILKHHTHGKQLFLWFKFSLNFILEKKKCRFLIFLNVCNVYLDRKVKSGC